LRQVGLLPPGLPAGGLRAVLAARGLETLVRDDALWVLDEDALPEARAELARFRREPERPDWRSALTDARERCDVELAAARLELAGSARRAWRRERRVRRAYQAAASSRPLTLLLLATGGIAAWAGSHDPSVLLPLVAGLYWLHELGTHVESLRGSRRFALLVLSLAAVSQLLVLGAGLAFAGVSGVASGVAFGLLGFTAARSSLDADSGLGVPRGLLPLMAAWLIACAAGAAPSSVLLAQCAGLVAGLLAGTLPVSLRRRDPARGHSR
jgi:hypothetical protein